MWCPRCIQGYIREVRINALNVDGFLCEECDALWFRRDDVGPTGFVDFTTFMEGRGLKGLWSEVTQKQTA
jgi:hypothetical protein